MLIWAPYYTFVHLEILKKLIRFGAELCEHGLVEFARERAEDLERKANKEAEGEAC